MLEVMMASPAPEFNFDSACTTPYASAPSSPRGFGNYYYASAPTSPTTATSIYNDVYGGGGGGTGFSGEVPFYWRENSDLPKNRVRDGDDEEFDFEFSGQLVMGSDEGLTATADELFEAGVIRPLKKPPPLLQIGDSNGDKSIPSSPKSRFFRSAAYRTPKDHSEFNPLINAGIEETTRGRDRIDSFATGRERSSSRRSTRSLSPLRRGSFDFREESSSSTSENRTVPPTTVSKSGVGGGCGGKKWRLRDFFLFRSASEGRVKGNGKDPLAKYTASLSPPEDSKNSTSFQSTDGGSVGRRSSRRSISSSQFYGSNRAVSEELRRKTFLPYRQGLLGCLGFNPSVDGLAKAFGSIAGGHRR